MMNTTGKVQPVLKECHTEQEYEAASDGLASLSPTHSREGGS